MSTEPRKETKLLTRWSLKKIARRSGRSEEDLQLMLEFYELRGEKKLVEYEVRGKW